MFFHYRTQGFILKKEERGETDRIFTIFTKDFGKLELLAKAERKIKSKLRGGLELFYLSEIEFIQGKTHKTLTDAISIEKFDGIRKDLKRLRIAYKIAEILDNLIKGQEPDEKIWHLLKEIFEKLNDCSLFIVHCSLVYYYFLWNLLSILGYQPELYNCIVCQKKLTPENIYFSPKEGGLICDSCKKNIKSSQKISPHTVKIIRILLKKDWPILKRLKIEAKDLELIRMTSDHYLSEVLGKIQ